LINVLHGEKIDEPTVSPVKAGYTFAGWYKTASYDEAWDFDNDMVDSELTLYAKWAIAHYSVVFDSRDGSPVSSIGNLLYGAKISEPVSPTKDKHVFDGWYKDTSYTQRWYFTTDIITQNMTLYAKWIAPHKVIFNSQGGSVVAGITEVTHGDTILEPSAPNRSGYAFGGWYKEASLIHSWNFGFNLVTSDIMLFAKWIPLFLASFNSSGGSGVQAIEVKYGDKLDEPNMPIRIGYSLDGWYKEVACINKCNFNIDTVISNITLYAKWIPLYTIVFDSQGGSEVALLRQ
jgi:uncharacterized repeat protein (TIGR02543 family)